MRKRLRTWDPRIGMEGPACGERPRDKSNPRPPCHLRMVRIVDWRVNGGSSVYRGVRGGERGDQGFGRVGGAGFNKAAVSSAIEGAGRPAILSFVRLA